MSAAAEPAPPAEKPRRPWRPERRNVRALDKWIRETYGAEAPRYGTS